MESGGGWGRTQGWGGMYKDVENKILVALSQLVGKIITYENLCFVEHAVFCGSSNLSVDLCIAAVSYVVFRSFN